MQNGTDILHRLKNCDIKIQIQYLQTYMIIKLSTDSTYWNMVVMILEFIKSNFLNKYSMLFSSSLIQ